MIELRLLRYFVTVAEMEHVGRASKALHVSQSPLSRQIRQLEDATGLHLFVRERQRIRITADGKWLLERARRILADVQALERDALRRAKGEGGMLRVGFVRTAMSSALLPEALRRFGVKHPDVALELRAARSEDQLRAVIGGEVDVGVVHEAAADARLSCVLLREEPLVLVVPRGDALARKEEVGPEDLHGRAWIALRTSKREPRPNEDLLAACEKLGFVPDVRLAAHDQETVLGLVGEGMGIAFLPESFSASGGERVSVRRVPWLGLHRRLYGVTRAADTSPITKDMLACLEAGAANGAPRASATDGAPTAPASTRARRRPPRPPAER